MEIEGLEDYIQHSRIRSLRRKKRSAHEAFDKRLIAFYKEQKWLTMQMKDLGYEDLSPPVQRGWKRSFVLRPDVVRGKDAKFFQGLLDKINTTHYSWRKDFKRKQRKGGKKIYVVRPQDLQRLWPQDFEKLKFTDREKAYFDLTIVHDAAYKTTMWRYVFNEAWRFTLRVQPNVITKTKVRDFNIERRLSEINGYLDRNNLHPYLMSLLNGNYQWRHRTAFGDLAKYKGVYKNKMLDRIIEEYLDNNDEQISPRIVRGFSFLKLILFCFVSSQRQRIYLCFIFHPLNRGI